MVDQVFTKNLQINPQIKGLAISGVDILLRLFADDTDLFLEAMSECVTAVVAEINKFGMHSGCRGNLAETKCIPLGSTRYDIELIYL